jgi:hypothetical protein
MLRFLGRDVPVTIYLIILYAILVYGQDVFFGQPVLDIILGEIQLVSAASLVVTGSWVFVALTFVALFVENIRATKIRGHTANDYLSIAALVAALVLLLVVPQFGTMTFVIIFIACLFDVAQDRIIGQAVARRDWGVQVQE